MKLPFATSQTACWTAWSERLTIDMMMCSGSFGRSSTSTPLVKKSRSAAASNTPELPAAATAAMYFAPFVFCDSASSFEVAGSLKELPQPTSTRVPGLVSFTPCAYPLYQRRTSALSIAPTKPTAFDAGHSLPWSPLASIA